MVTLYDIDDLIEFGYYLLSEERTDLIKQNTLDEEESEDKLKEKLSLVYHADVTNWINIKQDKLNNKNLQSLEQEEDLNK